MNDFRAGSLTHGIVLICLMMMSVGIILLGRAVRSHHPRNGIFLDRALAIALMFLWIGLTCRALIPGHLRWDNCLPLHICRLTGLIAPLVLWTQWRSARAILYFWGLGLCTQAFSMPLLYVGPAHLDFWAYWIGHTAIVTTAIYDMVVRGFRPNWRDFHTAVLASAVYVLVVFPIDIRLGVNYGYLGKTDVGQAALVRALGPWPQRVPRLVAIIWAGMALMALPCAGRLAAKKPEIDLFATPSMA